MDSAPSENPVNTSMVSSISSEFTSASGAKIAFNMINNPPSPNTASPATPSPITEPPVKETFSDLLRLVRAA
jgi:hypothetical protein